MVLFATAEEDLFSKIEDECIQAIKKLYEDSGFAVVAPRVPDQLVIEGPSTRFSPQWFNLCYSS